MRSEWQVTSFGRIRKVPPMEAATWRCSRRLVHGQLRRDWLPAEMDRLIKLTEAGYGYRAIARKMKRSTIAVILKCKRMNCRLSTVGATLSASDVAILLGKQCQKSVSLWIEQRALKARNAGTRRRPFWRIQWDDLLAFMERRDYWMAWDPSSIDDLALREWAVELRGAGRWLTIGEAAERYGVISNTVNTWIRRGLLPATRYGNWWVWSEDAATFTPPCERPRQQTRGAR